MDKIKSITDIHLFAENLIFKLPNNEIPANIKITVNLHHLDWEELRRDMDKMPMIIKIDRNYKITETYMMYTYNGVSFDFNKYLL